MSGPPVAPGVKQRDKIVALEDLPRIREQNRGKTIVQCHGAFDLIHVGHLIHFEEARSLGDILVVTITADRHITKKRTVSFSENYRAKQVAALEAGELEKAAEWGRTLASEVLGVVTPV